ncbi:MAG TPA: hypothetical protein VFT64_06235 [Rickettsiales bacterium]|nr:hypothetical protein [Rickettsiales bacterium]
MANKLSYVSTTYTPPSRALSGENSIFAKVLSVLAAVADSRVGIGEVIHDYAVQTGEQIKTLAKAQESVEKGVATTQDKETLEQAGEIIKRLEKLLEILPGAMRRNNTETIGRKERITLRQIERLANDFARSPEAHYFLTHYPQTALLEASAV